MLTPQTDDPVVLTPQTDDPGVLTPPTDDPSSPETAQSDQRAIGEVTGVQTRASLRHMGRHTADIM